MYFSIYRSEGTDHSMIYIGWTTGVQFPAESENFSLRHRVQTGSGTYTAS